MIAVIAVLAALLSPALGRTMERGRAAKCAGNLRQVFLAAQAFANDNQGRIVSGGGEYLIWSDALVPYAGLEFNTYGNNGARPTGIFSCPSSKALCYGGARADFSVNYFANGEGTAESSKENLRFVSLPHPAKTIAFLDGAFPETKCNRAVAPWIDAATWGIAFRHGDSKRGQGSANAIYFDGHLEAVKKTDLPLTGNAWQKFPWEPKATE